MCKQLVFISFSAQVWCQSGVCAGSHTFCPLHYTSFLHYSETHYAAWKLCWQHPVTAFRLTQIPNMIKITQDSISDLKLWMTTNKLQLNDDKTDAYYHPKTTTSSSTPSVYGCRHCNHQFLFICPWPWCHSWQYSCLLNKTYLQHL